MHRQVRHFVCVLLAGITAVTGCAPTQPFYFMEDGDLSHYVDVATQIEYPDVEEPSLDEVTSAQAPSAATRLRTPRSGTSRSRRRPASPNSQLMRQLGGVVQEQAPETISRNLINSVAVTTTYDPALVESSTGTAFGSQFNGVGPEAALSAFDAQLDSSISWQKNDRPVNIGGFAAAFQSPAFTQDAANFGLGLTKTAATGTQFAFRNNTTYDANNNLILQGAPAFSQWGTNFETFISQPLLQGAGTQYNRIAGPFAFEQFAQNGVNPFDGVVLARIRTDLTLADFEGAARNLMRDVEQAYWNLYFSYRDLEARKIGRDSALQTWKQVAALAREGARGGSADREAQSRAQYFQFKAQVEQGLSSLYTAENRMRYIMGLSVSDGRLIRPADEPTTALVAFDWSAVHAEGLSRRVEVRKQKWEIKRRELELIAARNHLLPRLDAFGTYRWLGAGDDLFGDDRGAGSAFTPDVGAFNVLTDGNFQEWEMGLRFSLPIGFRQQLSTVRHHQLLLARERALLQDLELEVSHQLGDAFRDLDLNYSLTETNFNRRSAAQREVEAVESSYKANRATLDLLLDAQRRRSDAETAYYRSLVDYNLAITDVHYRKGSLLDYNGVYLAEGPWPGKAYFDAMRRARQRDASVYLDYGYTRPGVMSRGPHAQRMESCGVTPGEMVPGAVEGFPTPAGPPYELQPGEMMPGTVPGLGTVPGEVEILQPTPMDGSYGAAEPAARGQLFAAPGEGRALAGISTGYETNLSDGTGGESAAIAGGVLPASAQLPSNSAAGSGNGVVQAHGEVFGNEHRGPRHAAHWSAAAAPVGAGRKR